MGSTLSSLLSIRQASASSIGFVVATSSFVYSRPESNFSWSPHFVHRPSTYRLPPRYTLHDSKRLTFVADLANPLVPLHKLSKSIPHGFKGGELLEMLWSNGVSLERGVWFAKVVGASEMVSSSSLLLLSFLPPPSSFVLPSSINAELHLRAEKSFFLSCLFLFSSNDLKESLNLLRTTTLSNGRTRARLGSRNSSPKSPYLRYPDPDSASSRLSRVSLVILSPEKDGLRSGISRESPRSPSFPSSNRVLLRRGFFHLSSNVASLH